MNTLKSNLSKNNLNGHVFCQLVNNYVLNYIVSNGKDTAEKNQLYKRYSINKDRVYRLLNKNYSSFLKSLTYDEYHVFRLALYANGYTPLEISQMHPEINYQCDECLCWYEFNEVQTYKHENSFICYACKDLYY